MRRALAALLFSVVPAFAATDTLQPVKEGLANKIASAACSDMRFRIQHRRLCVAPFRNDPEGLVTKAFSDAITGNGNFDLVTKSTIREWWDAIVGNNKDAPLTWKQAVELGNKLDAECVLFGRVESMRVDEGHSECDVSIRIINVKDDPAGMRAGDGIFIGRFRTKIEESFLSGPYFEVWIGSTSLWIRVLIWVVALLILPFLTLLAREHLAQAAPIVPIGLMILITGMDMVLALFMMGFAAKGILAWVLIVGALAVSIFYNLTILAKVAQLQLPGKD